MQQPYRSVWTELLGTPFRQAWIDAGGLKTRFIQAGDPANPPLVLMHGTAGSLENFAANIAAHARHFNCIAFDMIGSGMTDKPDYDYETQHYVKHAVDFLNAIGVKKASVSRALPGRPRCEPPRHRPSAAGRQAYPAVSDGLFSGKTDTRGYQALQVGGCYQSDVGEYFRNLQRPVSRSRARFGTISSRRVWPFTSAPT